MISYAFPPVGGGAVIRITKFAKYLSDFGWDPIILTAEQFPAKPDFSLLKEVKGIQVVHTPMTFFDKIRKFLVRKFISPKSSKKEGAKAGVKKRRYNMGNLLSKLENALQYVLIPDQQIFWNRKAYKYAKSIIQKENISIVYTIVPPQSTNFIGMKLKKKLGIKWITDFRDVWTAPSSKKRWWLQKRIEERMEKEVIRSADHIITTTIPSKDYLMRIWPNDTSKFSVIHNGFDPADFEGVELAGNQRSEKLRLISMGGVSKDIYQGIQNLHKSIERLGREGLVKAADFKIEFLSAVDPNVFCENPGDFSVDYVGFLPHKECLSYASQGDVLFFVLFHKFADNSYPGKMFEYMALGKPVLGLTQEGIVSRFVEKHKMGWVVDDRDESQIDTVVLEIYGKWKQGELRVPGESEIKKFDRKNLTKELSDILEAIY